MKENFLFGENMMRPNLVKKNKKGWFILKNRLLALLGITFLSFLVLSGCGVNDQDPPPEDNEIIDDGDLNDNDQNQDGLTDNPADDRVDDENRDGDMDMMEDDNTPGEDIIEDKDDMRDNDNQDR